MELRPLRYFVAIADAGTVTAAAAALHLTQPSMSRQVHQLERELGIELFVRDRGPFRLSAAGSEFLPVARRLLTQADAALETARAIAAGRLRSLTISAPGTTLTDVVAPFLATLTAGDPMPAVWEEAPPSVYATLDRGADLAIGTTPWPAHLDGLPLAELPVWAYVRPDDPWAQREAVGVDELVTRPVLLQNRDFHPRRALDQALAAAGLAYGSFHEFASAEVAQAVAASGRGVAVVSDDPRFDLRPVGIHGVRISLYAAWEPHHHGAETIAAIAARLRAFCAARYGL
ncbi:LysR family transcriptional regulator [Actinoplanes sp. Pm04-4]|uniref:LysR family transcriptional regulator n=1 Tax=Paractinoplanes pyxinae TaxID=2997416 RepID=A0ABT4AS14_9ACTN|nr:LysR family transcriptional regulator [Actinoplanes pyxinae]MCY1137028.1 LysR family transcriptional regulator [Actinoplanes pyxinae]